MLAKRWKPLAGICIAACALTLSPGCATSSQAPAPAPAPTPSAPVNVKALQAQGMAAYDQKQYVECARMLSEADRADPAADSNSAYSIACCQALAGDKEAAFAALRLANERGFKDSAHLERDTDLTALHSDTRWAEAVAQTKANKAATLKGANEELLGIYEADQGDRMGPDVTKLDWKVVSARDEARRARVKQILDGGGAKVALDYFHAAMVFQHGKEVADFQRSHSLAVKASELDPALKQARWLAAASKDRELMNLGKPQLYGTQFRVVEGKWELYTVDPSITDEERAKWNVPPLGDARKKVETMNARPR
ncbi:hypothetical protein MYSTI_02742 [Myxococcus stipitatus DSM 14675]|uniref:Lipoprotein n=1 Tax=Myxococcus stipitatus (strain DSM 14675 / JCM 12634 / Mx s8) TaxID=1278073 RepID=L7U7I1_MYXSD|nr:hypothetical protein MYSTI_02742 [Myxococcus stipitatus DSM 14675]